MEEDDHISNLPDAILHDVLSHLPTPEDAARTSLLSRKFRSVWNSFPDIIFDREHATSTQLVSLHHSLARRPPALSIRKFMFRLHLGYCSNMFDETLLLAVRRKAVEVHLDLDPTDLHLSNKHYFVHNAKFHFYRFPQISCLLNKVRVLYLKGFCLDSDHLRFQYWPVLEELILKQCKGPETFTISSQSLIKLVINDCVCSVTKKLQVIAAKLEDFTLKSLRKRKCDIDIVACKALKSISLSRVNLNLSDDEGFANNIGSLNSLSLTDVNLTDDWLCVFLTTQGNQLKTLKLSGCDGATTLCVTSNCLESVELIRCPRLFHVTIHASSLQRFCYCSETSNCVINISACIFLKTLVLRSVDVSNEWFDCVSLFSFLEDLEINRCNNLKKLVTTFKHLKELKLIACNGLQEVDVDAIQLIKFRYESWDMLMFSPPLINSTFVEASLIWYPPGHPTLALVINLFGFLKNFGHCRVLKFDFKSNKLFNVPMEMRKIGLPPLRDLKHIEVKSATDDNLEDLVDSLLWICPRIETLTIIPPNKTEPMKVLQFKYVNTASAVVNSVNELCCDFCKTFKCWRHFVNGVALVNFNNDERQALSRYFQRKMTKLINVEKLHNIGVEETEPVPMEF